MVSEAAMRASRSGQASAGNCLVDALEPGGLAARIHQGGREVPGTRERRGAQGMRRCPLRNRCARANPWARSDAVRFASSLPIAGTAARCSAVKRMRVQTGGGFAKCLKRFAQAGHGALRGRRGIVQLMRQTRRDLAQRGHFVLLILQPGEVADTIGKQRHQARPQHRHDAPASPGNRSAGKAAHACCGHRADGCRKVRHARIRQHARNHRRTKNPR